MEDQILHAIICDGNAQMIMINASMAAEECAQRLNLSEGVAYALGRLMCAAASLAQRNKSESEKLTVIVNGGGACGKLLVTADNAGNVKACADVPNANMPTSEIDISALVGRDGQMTVVRDNPLGREPYVGMCGLVTGDITRDFAAYLVVSEQQPAAVALDCGMADNKLTCGGIVVFPLPGCPEETLNSIDKKISNVNDLLQKLNYHLSLEEMALDMFWDVGVKPLETLPLQYKCDCSRERFAQALLTLGRTELLSMAYDEKPTEIRCQFCNAVYSFSKDELKELAQKCKK